MNSIFLLCDVKCDVLFQAVSGEIVGRFRGETVGRAGTGHFTQGDGWPDDFGQTRPGRIYTYMKTCLILNFEFEIITSSSF